jgi:D-beta-D-heptose 7-phosphate kinase/D-beta-D-heptose 1-phosphate adenosyltransferase
MSRKNIAVSGGFDPIHVGHIRMIRAAADAGDVIILLNSDNWLIRKKGYTFMGWDERSEILMSIKGVAKVIHAIADDGTVCDALREAHADIGLHYFANGGDRIKNNTPEMSVCEELGIELLWNCGGGKIQSSSGLVNKRMWSQDGMWNVEPYK